MVQTKGIKWRKMHTQLDADLLEISDGVVSRVVREICEWSTLSTTTLIDENHAVDLGVKITSHGCVVQGNMQCFSCEKSGAGK
jgi:hypothetical protein